MKILQLSGRAAGYNCIRPANIDLRTGRRLDGRSVGRQLAATLPNPLDTRGMYTRLFGREVTVTLDGQAFVSGFQREIAAWLREQARTGRSWQGQTIPWPPEQVALLLEAADRIEALDLVGEVAERGPTVRRPTHTGHRNGVLQD